MSLKRWLFVLVFMIFLVALCSFFYGTCNNKKVNLKEFKKKDKELKDAEIPLITFIDSSKNLRDSLIKELNKKNKYNENHDTIYMLNGDEQFEFFSNWISEIDTFKK